MALTESSMLPLGTPCPEFELPDPDGKEWSLHDFADNAVLVVAFICNHCPYVIHIREHFAHLVKQYEHEDVAFVAINSNNIESHPQDDPAIMKQVAKDYDYRFPYLYDASQKVAKAFRAACTPDFYVFNNARKLVYRGQYDDSRPKNDQPITGHDLRQAINRALNNEEPMPTQKPSIGCNIKWKAGNEPDYV